MRILSLLLQKCYLYSLYFRARCPADVKVCQALDEHIRTIMSTKATTSMERLSVTDLCNIRDGWLAGPGAGVPMLNSPPDFFRNKDPRSATRLRNASPGSGNFVQPRKRTKSEGDRPSTGPVTCNRFNFGRCHSASGSTRCPKSDMRDHLCDVTDPETLEKCLKNHPAYQHFMIAAEAVTQQSTKAAKK